MSVRRRLFTGLVVLGALSEKASRAFLFLAVGVLRHSDLKEVARRSWSAYHATDAEIRSGLSDWEASTYGRFLKAGDRVCIVGCGSGRLVLALAAAGHDVVGVEPSPKPVARLRQILGESRQSATIIEAEIEDAHLPGAFDVFLFSANCYSYIRGSRVRTAVLEKLAEHLNPQGRIIVTYPRRERNWVNRSAKLAGMMTWLTRSDWHPEPYDSVMRLEVADEPGAILCEHFFLPEEVEREAASAGLRVVVHGEPWTNAWAVLGR